VALLYLGLFVVSLLCSFVFTRYVRNLANARGWVVEPSLDRHLHNTPVPQLGGIAIFLAFLAGTLLLLLVRWVRPQLGLDFSLQVPLSILAAGVLIFLLGVCDDFRSVGPYFKFTVQAVAASILFAGGLGIVGSPTLFGHHAFPWFVGLPLTIVWVLAITNAFNLIDGLDGLAAGSAMFSTSVVFIVSLFNHAPLVSLMTLALAGAILGFLRYNFNPATIFLGDSGSLFIGFMLSALALQGSVKAPTILAVAIPVVSFGLPILETVLSVLRRWMSGRSLFTADREHIHHKLLELGLSQRQVVIILYAVSAMFALCSLFLLWPGGSALGIAFVVLGSGVWIGVQHLRYVEFGELGRLAQRTLEQRRIFINDLTIRRAVEQLRQARTFEEVYSILVAAFTASDFDAFELRLPCLIDVDDVGIRNRLPVFAPDDGCACLRWQGKRRHPTELGQGWSLSLELTDGHQRHYGSMKIYRSYWKRGLQLDTNLLTSEFPAVLADALNRTLSVASPAKPSLKEGTQPTIVAKPA
jgi:UDP-GlcNAc:undecaprenyl-phosphate/decaprenyl-phosphate GlcNAc-1-phosphate transferase